MMTVSNENKTRVDYLVYKKVNNAFNHLKKAADFIHDTGDTDSDTLDKAVSCTQDAIEQLESFLRKNS